VRPPYPHSSLGLLGVLAGAVVLVATCDRADDPSDIPVGTEEMVRRLAPLANETDRNRNRFANEAIIADMLDRAPPRGADRRLEFERDLAEQLLYAGRHKEAIQRLDSLLARLDRYQASAPPTRRAPESFGLGLLDLKAIAHLRLAEQRACIREGQATDCAIPRPERFWGADVHLEAAIFTYTTILEADPEALGPRWMLNIAHMMRGDWPDGVPQRWRIEPDVFEPEFEIGDFRNIAGELGVDVRGNVGGAVTGDFDKDGFLDLLVSSWGPADTLRLFTADGRGGFRDATVGSGLVGLFGGGNLKHADYDNDGDLDVLVLRGGWLYEGQPNSLLRNRGDGTFEDVTEGVGILEAPNPSQTAAWADLNLDGWVDLVVGNETFGDIEYPAQLFLNRGDGTFRNVASEAGTDIVGVIKGVTAGDIDNDGDADLYFTRIGQPNVLLRNDGVRRRIPRFTDVTEASGTAKPMDAFPAWFFDYDNDGWEDLFVAGYRTRYGDILAEYLGLPHDSETARLYRNRGDGTFEDVSSATRLDRILFAMGSNFGDLDNDGWEDLFIGTGDAYFQALLPNRVFRNDDGQRFQEVTGSRFGLYQKGHGVSYADLDHDGDQDVYVTMGGAYAGDLARNTLWENPGHGNAWITLLMEGTRANRSAIGARVRITVTTPDGPRTLFRTVGGGGSFGANSLRLEVGLGKATGQADIQVDWPGGETERFEGAPVNAIWRIVEGVGRIQPAGLAQVELGGR